MRKKILIAEQSETTRGVAENVLRQQGFEVISISNGDKALDVLELSRPNLILVDHNLTVKGTRTLFEKIQESPLLSAIPFLIICDEEADSSAFPDEVKITRPIDPKELILKVTVLGGDARPKPSGNGPNPLDEGQLEDDLLEAALGMDQIDVTNSATIENSSKMKKTDSKSIEKMIGMEHDHDLDINDDSGGSKIESTKLEDEDLENGKNSKDHSKSSKLEILSDHDQFGLGGEAQFERSGEHASHDYEWFVNEMKKDNSAGAKTIPPKPAGEEAISPKASAPDAPAVPLQKKTDSGKLKSENVGVDRFIEDFRKEVEKFGDAPKPVAVNTAKAAASPKSQPQRAPKPNSGLDNMTAEQVEVFKQQFVNALAEKVAEKIATKIDAQKLLSLIKNEIISVNQKQ